MTPLTQGPDCPVQVAVSIECLAGVWDEILAPYQQFEFWHGEPIVSGDFLGTRLALPSQTGPESPQEHTTIETSNRRTEAP